MFEIVIAVVASLLALIVLKATALGNAQRERHIKAMEEHQKFLEEYQRWIDSHAAKQAELCERILTLKGRA